MRRPQHDGQKPPPPHENGTSRWCAHGPHVSHAKPVLGSPRALNFSSSRHTNDGRRRSADATASLSFGTACRTTRCTRSVGPCPRRSTVTMVQRGARTRPTESPWSAALRRPWTTPSHVRSSASDAPHRRRSSDNCQSSLPGAADRHALLGSSTCPPRTAPWRSVTPPRAAPAQLESHGTGPTAVAQRRGPGIVDAPRVHVLAGALGLHRGLECSRTPPHDRLT
jgi:hypothetical protein